MAHLKGQADPQRQLKDVITPPDMTCMRRLSGTTSYVTNNVLAFTILIHSHIAATKNVVTGLIREEQVTVKALII